MNIIFWDVDGVLNHPRIWARWTEHERFDPTLVRRARRIVRATDARCVLSSAWRLNNGYHRTLRFLSRHGWPEAHRDFIGQTPYLDCDRGHEISAWLQKHPHVTAYVIVDDNADMTTHQPRLVQTDYRVGLTDANAEMIARLLRTDTQRAA